jgi:hypothetical protein
MIVLVKGKNHVELWFLPFDITLEKQQPLLVPVQLS